MATLTDRYGNALLSLSTRRPPDLDRGAAIVHLPLTLPAAIAAQVGLWETGGRGALLPREAAEMLWAQPVAQYLNGRVDAWKSVPGVAALLPAHQALTAADPQTWPADRAALRAFVAQRAPGSQTWDHLEDELVKGRALEQLNDLVLIFKYAAIGRQRPLRLVAELYRLALALLSSTDPPQTQDAIVAWLAAPLVSPRVFGAPLGPAGPRPPATGGGGTVPPLPPPFNTDLLNARLDRELAGIEEARRLDRVRGALMDAGVRDPRTLTAIARVLNDAVATPATDIAPARWNPAVADGRRGQPRVIQAHIYGTAVMLDAAEALARIARLRRERAHKIAEALPPAVRQRLEAAGAAIEDLTIWPDLIQAVHGAPSYLEPVGRSDLLIVRQTTIGYRRTEIAYVENILIGETRGRDHTNRVLTRQELFESVERETEESRDLQTTDRAELSREVSKVVSEDLSAQGNTEVTSRGPTTVVASAGVSFQRSTEEAAKTAESYARETIERAVKRTMERVTRQSRAVFEQETTEVNHHGFTRDGNATEHVTGVYQYLERVSRARIFWYGERELYDLLIPEPAALIWQLAMSRKELHLPLEQPDEDLFRSLTVDTIASKREEVIRAFRVTDMPAPPAETLEAAVAFSATGSGDGAHYANSKELSIPEGYVVTAANFVASAEVESASDQPNGGVAVGGDVWLFEMTLQGNKGSADHDFVFTPALAGPTLAVAMNADNYTSLIGSVTAQLKLTDEARHQWALTAFGRVAERYEQLRREYAQALIQATASQPLGTAVLPSGSRLQLNQIVRAELQRSAVDIMRNAPASYDLIDDVPYANADGTLGTHPVADLAALRATEPEVRFLQHAFEWEHLAWVLYPYFWGRRSEWSRTVVVSHPDPDFAAFLNAGAARVQIPVRPGFEDMVKHFMETGEVYEGDGLPKMGDPGYVTFIDEQMTSLGAPGDEVPWPPDAPREWDVVAPTSLVLVRPAQAALPTWDPETGEEL